MASATLTASGVNRYLPMPVMNTSGKKTIDRGDRRHQHGHGDFVGAVQRRLERRLAHAEVADGVLDVHDGVIDDAAQDQGQAAQRHDVERLAGEVQAGERGQERQRDGQGDDPGACAGCPGTAARPARRGRRRGSPRGRGWPGRRGRRCDWSKATSTSTSSGTVPRSLQFVAASAWTLSTTLTALAPA